ncbi:EamA family transporter [Paenibacillus baekrokdamisoli]|uniref:EamA family transporter n=1 Tax=Paenibacillus baekrokdamisoli TaxID=1712516 RepID=A0A3G9INS1_9BACL|nr:EamA family transporter [Paenibacillus baekrokdamisoli]MBB3072441.1 drug/metabolite transporter (DMT)-like permease [Paenibacillus baekrokdamisoli]BBH20500.1 EamA family transporter [Paenibacillus baekrokdamisoli]
MNKGKYIGLVLLTTLVMGLAFPVGKIGLSYAPPFFLMGIRFVLAGVILAIIVSKKPRSRPVGRKQWLQAAVVGLFQSAGVMGCAYYSMNWITSGESSIITCTNPLLVIVLGTLLTGAVYRKRQWLGVAVGFIGVVFTFGLHMGIQTGTFISFAGAVSFASATLLVKRWGSTFDMTVLAAYQMIAGGVVLFILSAISEHPYFIFSGTSVMILLWLVIMSSIVQFSVWFYLLRNGDPAKTSAFLFLVPLFGVLSSWVLLGEQIQWYVGVGGAFICVGIFLVNWEGSKNVASLNVEAAS